MESFPNRGLLDQQSESRYATFFLVFTTGAYALSGGFPKYMAINVMKYVPENGRFSSIYDVCIKMEKDVPKTKTALPKHQQPRDPMQEASGTEFIVPINRRIEVLFVARPCGDTPRSKYKGVATQIGTASLRNQNARRPVLNHRIRRLLGTMNCENWGRIWQRPTMKEGGPTSD